MSANPRNRDLRALAGHVTPRVRPQALPPVTSGNTVVDRAFAVIKDVLDRHAAATGNDFDRWLMRRDLEDLGLDGSLTQGGKMPSDQAGVAVWTSRRRLEMVSLAALADALQQHLTMTAGASADEIADLKRRVAALRPGVSVTDLNAAMTRLQTVLPAKWRTDIAGAVLSLNGQLQQALAAAAEVRELVARTVGGFDHDQDVAAAVWTIAHGLGRYPSVTVLNATNEKVEPDVAYTDFDNLTITHGRAMAGKARLR